MWKKNGKVDDAFGNFWKVLEDQRLEELNVSYVTINQEEYHAALLGKFLTLVSFSPDKLP